MKIYMDMCCLNRPFDDQSQVRVRLETEAILLVLDDIQDGKHELIASEALEVENNKNPNLENAQECRNLMSLAKRRISVSSSILVRAEVISGKGFGVYDALHISCAEAARADLLLSTDDNLVKLSSRWGRTLKVKVANPLDWIKKEYNA